MLHARRSHSRLTLALICGLVIGFACADEIPLETLLAEHRYEEALASLLVRTEEWALEAKKDPSPETNLDWARSLLSLGMVEDRLARYPAAREHLLTSLELMEDIEGTDALLGDCHDALGLVASHAGDFIEAEKQLLQAIDFRQQAPENEREPWLSASMDHLGLTYLEDGRYEEAGQLFHESLDATDPQNDALMAQRLGYLARYYLTIHNNARARDLLLEAMPRAESAWGRDHPNTLTLLSQLGLTALRMGETEEARAIFEEVTTLAREQAKDTTSTLRLAGFLNLYGSLNLIDGNPKGAEPLFREALEALEDKLGPNHLALAPLRNNLACTLQDLEDFTNAESLLRQTRQAYLDNMGPDHQRSVEALTNLALNTLLMSGPAAAKSEIAEASTAAEHVLNRLIRFGSERQRLNYLQNVDLLSLSCSAGTDPALIANTLLATKGRLLDVLLAESSRESTPALRKYRATRQQLDLLLLSTTDVDPEQIATLRTELHALERQVASQNSNTPHSTAVTWQELQASLPPDAAFVDFIRFTDYTAERELRYGALLILPTGDPTWIPLGTESSLQTWLGALSRRLDYRATKLGGKDSSAPVLKLKPSLRQLHQQFWKPIESLLPPEVSSLCLCPDASLNFLSFAVLLDDEDQFLVHRYPLCSYVSSGRDLLLETRDYKASSAPSLIMAVDHFAEAATPNPRSSINPQLADTITALKPLAGAKREATLIAPLLGQDTVTLIGSEAMESSLRDYTHVASAKVLHLITHGFFLSDNQPSSAEQRLQDFDDNPMPLYRSGLVLHLAKHSITTNKPRPQEEDGILFASDVATLPLQNTELVTLSSCQSALGETLSGEGVLGLRRGFANAGSRHLLLTLWPVSDDTTPLYMQRFYELAAETGHLSQSAWQAQREGLSTVDPNNAEQLEFAVLTVGPFVLCQRQGLTPPKSFSPPSKPGTPRHLYIALGTTLVLLIIYIILRRKATS